MELKGIVAQSLPFLLLLTIGDLLAGSIFSHLSISFSIIPGIIIIVPAIIGMRGNISSALGSRLGSAAHLGIIDAKNIFNKPATATDEKFGVDRLIGQAATAVEEVTGDRGSIKLGGEQWQARSQDGGVIPADSKVIVAGCDGNKLMVKGEEPS